MIRLFSALLISAFICSCSAAPRYASLQKELDGFVEGKDAAIGVAVIIDGKDTVAVNGDKEFPMLSVYKLPIALALGNHLLTADRLQPERIIITQKDLLPDTYSPMRDRYAGMDSVEITLHEVMAYALQQSDNNASDILLRLMGGTDRAAAALRRLDAGNIHIVSTEEEIYADPQLCYRNCATPMAMAKLIDRFDREAHDKFSLEIKQLLETCETGKNRLAAPLHETGAVIGHKTGTGFTLPDGRLMAINDAGYVHLPDGRRYTIAVFIENSAYSMEETETLIAIISSLVHRHLTLRQ